MLSPWLGLGAVALIYLGFAPFRQVALGVPIALIIMPLLNWIIGQPLSIGDPVPTTLGLFAILILALIRRVVEPRTQISSSVSMGELIINRLLFDRDIRSREIWIHQTRQAEEPLEAGTKPAE